MIMRIVSWNCHYGLNKEKAEIILGTFPDTDIFVIQECKQKDIYFFDQEWKFKDWYGDDQDIKSDLGVAIFSKNQFVERNSGFNRKFRYVVPYTIKTNKKSLTLFAVWTKSVPFYYDKNVTQAVCLSEYKDLISGDAIIIGDFNTGYSKDHQDRYNDLCKNLNGFKNCAIGKPEELKETFYSFTKNKLYLNDFCFVSENLYTETREIKIYDDWTKNEYEQKSWRGLSDHCPISVDFNF
jgi:exonuclease III